MLCNGYTELENTKKADEYTRAAESACAGKQEYELSLANLFFLQHRYSQAETHARRAIGINKQDPLAHTLLGKITLASGKFEQAAGHALDALELTQAVPEAHLLLGVALLWLGDGMNAMQSFRNALHFDDKLKDAHRFAGMLLTKIGQGKEATYHLQKAEELRMLHPVSFIHEHLFGAKDFAMKNNLPF
jgi:Flp pilus assembly protein TadD